MISILDCVRSLGAYEEVTCVVGECYEGIEWKNGPSLSKEQVENELERLQNEERSKEYQRLREFEYPDFREYLDAVVKGDQEQIQQYIQKCLDVKEKYPKPE